MKIEIPYKSTTDINYDKYSSITLVREMIEVNFKWNNVIPLINIKPFIDKYDKAIRERIEEKRKIIEARNIKQNLGNKWNFDNYYKGEVGELLVSYILKGKTSVNLFGGTDITTTYKGQVIPLQVKAMLSNKDPKDMINSAMTFDIQENQVHWNELFVIVLISTDWNSAKIVLSENFFASEIKKNFHSDYHIPENTSYTTYTGKNYTIPWSEVNNLRIKLEDKRYTFAMVIPIPEVKMPLDVHYELIYNL